MVIDRQEVLRWGAEKEESSISYLQKNAKVSRQNKKKAGSFKLPAFS